MSDPVLTFTPRGIYCPAGDFHIDPWAPVPRALITHGHADHARPGMGAYLASDGALPVIRHRLGEITSESLPYGQPRQIGGAQVSFHPAGHLPGSAQIRVEVGGEVWVASGDYKTTADGLAEDFEPIRCHSFITESTFGLPVFKWQPQANVAVEINQWWKSAAADGRFCLLGAYSLGKAQRLLSLLDPQGPILTHGAVEATNEVLRAQGYHLPDTIPITPDLNVKDYPGAMVIAPPSAMAGSWARRFGRAATGFASGWMRLRGIRRRRSVDRGFVLSDHADWDELNSAIRATEAENIYVTHGYTDTFTRHLNGIGLNAQVVPTEFGADGEEAE